MAISWLLFVLQAVDCVGLFVVEDPLLTYPMFTPFYKFQHTWFTRLLFFSIFTLALQ